MNFFDKKYQIFISSTFSDLVAERSEVIKVILDIYQIPIGMEMFSADNDDQWNTIKTTIESSDYYLLIIGHRYGSLTKEKISYTEKEFNYAKKLGIPILSFIKDRDLPTSPNQRDIEAEKGEKLIDFLKKVQSNSMCDYWFNETDLAKKVAVALPKTIFKTPRIGWIRSDKVNTLATSEELTKLNQENRELRDEIQKFKASLSNEKPKIDVIFNGSKKIELNHQEIRNSIIPNLSYDELDIKYQKYTSKEKFEIYNKEIEDKRTEIEAYQTDMNRYINLEKNRLDVDIDIINKGNVKVNDLFVDIFFPAEIVIYEKSDIGSLKKPENPISYPNPVNESLIDYKKSQLSNSLSNFILPTISSSPLLGSSISSLIARPNKRFYVDSNENKLTIKLEKLSHTRKYKLSDEVCIVGLKKGIFQAVIKIVADEILNTETKKLEIIVK